ncbi:hypothetical protein T11_7242 [Trichinella zimbabwensis]|uniref:Uncharacterized protein n=1 Tax=Trichinella zimbabwensis TaxID=268475 RepID=A0A0V1GTY7_9BILA|nr:hypothetical protein T11_7242 [Trichinella zimbabwensis]
MSGPVDQSGASVWNRGTGAAVDQSPVRSASFPFTLIFLSFILALAAKRKVGKDFPFALKAICFSTCTFKGGIDKAAKFVLCNKYLPT